MKKMKLKVNGIHCGGCAQKIKNAVCAIDSGSQVEVDVGTGDVEVKFESGKLKMGQVKEAISQVGFSIESMEIE